MKSGEIRCQFTRGNPVSGKSGVGEIRCRGNPVSGKSGVSSPFLPEKGNPGEIRCQGEIRCHRGKSGVSSPFLAGGKSGVSSPFLPGGEILYQFTILARKYEPTPDTRITSSTGWNRISFCGLGVQLVGCHRDDVAAPRDSHVMGDGSRPAGDSPDRDDRSADGVSFTGRMGTTLGDQWVPPERLRRGLFDHSRDQASSPAGLATTS